MEDDDQFLHSIRITVTNINEIKLELNKKI